MNLSALVREVAERMMPLADRAGCSVRLTVEEGVFARCDAMAMEQITDNLFSNAVRYGPGGPIEVTLSADGAMARLSGANATTSSGADTVRVAIEQSQSRVDAVVRPFCLKRLGVGCTACVPTRLGTMLLATACLQRRLERFAHVSVSRSSFQLLKPDF